MKENENKEPSKTAGAARQGGDTNTEIIGSAVSTAVGEPVLLNDRIAQLNREAQDQSISGELPSVYLARAVEREVVARLAAPTQAKPLDLSGLTRYEVDMEGYVNEWPSGGYVRFADVERLFAAPTQASAPQADELSISRQKLNMAKIDVLMDGARARSEEFRDGVTFGANSLHMKMLELAGASQASAAQEVRVVPEGMQTDLEQIAQSWDGCMVDAVGETMDVGATLRLQFKQLSTSTSAYTAPAAMDEKGEV